MTLAKVHSGQPFRMSAETFNAFVDAATAYQASQQSTASGNPAAAQPTGMVLVRNDSDADQERFAVLGLSDPLILPSANERVFLERPLFSVVSPDKDLHARRFCVLQEPIAASDVGRALVLGITPVRLDVQADDDELAAVVSDETGSLQTGSDGGARILWKDSGSTDTVWGIVQIPAGGGDAGTPNLVLSVTKAAHGWQLGDVLRWSGTAWEEADAGTVGDTDTLAVVGRIPDADTALLVLWGLLCLDGLEDHTDYWLDPQVPGTLTSTRPSEAPRLILHHAENRLCIVKAGASGGSGSATRFADLTDVDMATKPPTDRQAALWDAEAERWTPHDVVIADPIPAHQVLAGPANGAAAPPTFRDLRLDDLPETQACSVLGNPSGSDQAPSAIVAFADDRALLRVGGALQWLQITTPLLADDAVTDAKIADVGWAKLTGVPNAFPPTAHAHLVGGDLTGTTDNAHLRVGAVGAAALADGAVTDGKIVSLSWSKLTDVPTFPGSSGGALGGDLSGTTDNAQIVAGAVGTAEIADGTVTNAKLQHDSLVIGGGTYHLGDTVTGLLANPMTAKGDLIVGGAAGAPTRLPGNPGGTLQIVTCKSNVTALTAHVLDALEDVTIATPQDKQQLAFDAPSGQWRNTAAGPAGQNICLVGTITGRFSGNLYGAVLYPAYPNTATTWPTSVTQLQGDPTKVIPNGTWMLVCGNRKATATGYAVGDYDFFMQVPVWL